MPDVCYGCPCYGSLDCIGCGAGRDDERYGEDGDEDIFNVYYVAESEAE